ncbi:uncharacterized protein LOC128743649 [Sabethes cyaneus]|uniref:uncharacterized protein LOC128743649 n=1 Tax=Sabethes cyaneus TaxID=53552 RepID=UPI00237D998D|nr:uncharacterized protein LOC128743649 [Sabethes cyaneus]
MQIEEVLVDEEKYDFGDVEFLEDDDNEDSASVSYETVVRPSPNKSLSTKRKTPIFRNPGEVVTPSSMTPKQRAIENSSDEKPQELYKTSNIKASRKKFPTASRKKRKTPKYEPPSTSSDSDSSDSMVNYKTNNINSFTNEQLNRIELKLDTIMSRISHHDKILRSLKHSIKALQDTPSTSKGKHSEQEVKRPSKKRHKKLITFPVPDDCYLLRLEQLVQADKEIYEDLIDLYNQAPTTSVYEWMRKNTYALFINTSKYTWTGKMSNSVINGTASNRAQSLSVVHLLISTGCDNFPEISKDYMEKEFRRALGNFNDTKYIKWVKRAAKIKEQSTFSDTNDD